MALYLITAGTTPTNSGLVDTASGLAVDFSLVAKQGYVTTIGNGTLTSFTVTHNLGTQNVLVEVYRVASPYDTVRPDVFNSTTNTVTLTFAAAPATNEYRVLVQPN